MTLILELSPNVQTRLQEEAEREGVKPQELASRLIEQSLPPLPKTGAELLAYWEREDCLGLWQDSPESSVELARKLRRQAETRDWQSE